MDPRSRRTNGKVQIFLNKLFSHRYRSALISLPVTQTTSTGGCALADLHRYLLHLQGELFLRSALQANDPSPAHRAGRPGPTCSHIAGYFVLFEVTVNNTVVIPLVLFSQGNPSLTSNHETVRKFRQVNLFKAFSYKGEDIFQLCRFCPQNITLIFSGTHGHITRV